MPYVLISTTCRLESGPTIVGDEYSDPELMRYLDAKLVQQLGNNFMEWRAEEPPRILLDKLEKRGFRVVAVTGVGQTSIWTLHKSIDEYKGTEEQRDQHGTPTKRSPTPKITKNGQTYDSTSMSM